MALVLSRNPGESIMIGDGIEILIEEVRGDSVKVLVTAPREISVHRREVWLAIQSNKEQQ